MVDWVCGRRRAALPLLALTLIASFAAGSSQQLTISADEVGAPEPGKALIYLIRKNTMVGKAVLDSVSLDGMSWGNLPAGRYLVAQVSAGHHVIDIGGPRHNKSITESKRVSLTPGQELYLLRTHSFSKAASEPIPAAEASRYLEKLSPSPGNFLAAGVPRKSTASAAARTASADGGGARAAWSSYGRWAEVGVLISAERSEEAVALASRMLLASPDDPHGYFLRGLAYFIQGDNEFAEASFDRALQLQPGNGEALAYRGFTRERRRDYEAALQDLSAALELGVETTALHMDRLGGPWVTGVHRRRAAVLLALGQPDQAVADINAAMEIEPGNPFLYLERARAQLKAGRLEAAYDDAMTFAGLQPQLPWSYDLMAAVRWWQGDYAQSENLYRRALDRAAAEEPVPGPATGLVLGNLAMAERLNGNATQAMEHLKEAIRLGQEHPDAGDYLLLGTLLHEAARRDEARGAFQRAHDLDPGITAPASRTWPLGAHRRSIEFAEMQCALAASYLGSDTGSQPGAVATTGTAVTIHRVTVEPSPVLSGEPFSFVIDYTAADPAMPSGPLPVLLTVEVLADGAVVFSVPEQELSADNGGRSNWAQRMNPTGATGDFTVRVRIIARGAEAAAEVDFHIG